MNADLLAHLDDDTPCGRCGHAHGWHAANDHTDCRHGFGTPDQCECTRWEEPIA